jgi:hypothetical protein
MPPDAGFSCFGMDGAFSSQGFSGASVILVASVGCLGFVLHGDTPQSCTFRQCSGLLDLMLVCVSHRGSPLLVEGVSL